MEPTHRVPSSNAAGFELVKRLGRPALQLRRRVCWDLESRLHLRALAARRPELVPGLHELERQADFLRPAYAEYVDSVSRADMAIALKTASYMRALVLALGPARVIDLGSGFTSYALRSLATELRGLEVWSVDDSPEWLEKSRSFLEGKRCSTERLLTWEELLAREAAAWGSFDLVVHDLGNIETRGRTLPSALGLASGDGVVLLDDLHNLFYRPLARALLARQGMRRYSLYCRTADIASRHAWLVLPRS